MSAASGRSVYHHVTRARVKQPNHLTREHGHVVLGRHLGRISAKPTVSAALYIFSEVKLALNSSQTVLLQISSLEPCPIMTAAWLWVMFAQSLRCFGMPSLYCGSSLTS